MGRTGHRESGNDDASILQRRIRAYVLGRKRAFREIEAPLLADLADAGYPVESVYDLINFNLNHERALPILLHWLPRISDWTVKEGIVRALTFKWARPAAARPLLEEFRKLPYTDDRHHGFGGPAGGLKWAIGNALEVTADDSMFDELAAIALDRRHGARRAIGWLRRWEG